MLTSLLFTDFSINLFWGGGATAFSPPYCCKVSQTWICFAPCQVIGGFIRRFLLYVVTAPTTLRKPQARGATAPFVLFLNS